MTRPQQELRPSAEDRNVTQYGRQNCQKVTQQCERLTKVIGSATKNVWVSQVAMAELHKKQPNFSN